MEVVHPLLGSFSIIQKIGEGTFASVYYAKHSKLQYPVAIKIFHDHNNENDICNSLSITKSITHPFICKDFDFFKTQSGQNCILMEYVRGITLLQYANKNSPLPPDEIYSIFGQLVIAIDFLHQTQVIHRDLKCENIIIDKNKNIRLIDLNFSCLNETLHSTICGSPGYLAPEIINKELYSETVDIWCLGIILYAITYGKLPFENDNISILFKTIISQEPDFPHDPRVKPSLVDLIKKMLIKNPNDRISIDGIKKHPFFTNDSNNKNYVFNQQKINYFIRDPLMKMSPEMHLIQQMKLSINDSFKAISEIKSGNITYYSMTYKILFKNYLSNIQIQNYSKSFTSTNSNLNINKSKNTQTQSELPLLASDNHSEKFRTLSRSNSDDLMSSKDNFNIETENNNTVELKVLLNCNVHFRRFNSIAKPMTGIGIKKKSTSTIKNIHLVPQFKNYGKPQHSASNNFLPVLKRHEDK